jgi:uncharacterized protein
MKGQTKLTALLQQMHPERQPGAYVFCCRPDWNGWSPSDAILFFKEREGYTLIMEKDRADQLQMPYTFVAAWITLTVHSALEAVGLTAAFATALANAGISCNVVAAYYHDHLFVPVQDAEKAMAVLRSLAAGA